MIKMVAKSKGVTLPYTLEYLRHSISEHEKRGMNIVFFNDINAEEASIAFSSPVGYGREARGNSPGGLSYLVQRSLMIFKGDKELKFINRNGDIGAETCTWSISCDMDDIELAFEMFWENLGGLRYEKKLVEEEVEWMNFE